MKTLIAGIGSTILGDDGVGIHVCRRLDPGKLPPQVEVIELGTGGLALIDFIEGKDRLILVDAIVTGATPGTVFELRGDDIARAAHLSSTHQADLPTTLALCRTVLGIDMPQEIVVIAIEAKQLTTFSEQLTPQVELAIPLAVQKIEQML